MPITSKKKHGVVTAFNVSPKGSYEGLLLETSGEIIQANFPQDWSAGVSELALPGAEVELQVEPREAHGHPNHSVYNLLKLTRGERSFPALEHRFEGKVIRLNYALHGEVNGAILDTGDFLHVKPHGAAALGLKAGMRVEGAGSKKPMVGGRHVIEAVEVNGVPIDKKPKPRKHAGR